MSFSSVTESLKISLLPYMLGPKTLIELSGPHAQKSHEGRKGLGGGKF